VSICLKRLISILISAIAVTTFDPYFDETDDNLEDHWDNLYFYPSELEVVFDSSEVKETPENLEYESIQD
jgi:hypothetical protein